MGDSTYGLLSPSSIQEKYILDGSKEARRFENGQNVIITVAGEDGKRDRDSTLVATKGLSDFKSETKPRLLTVHGPMIACHMHVENADMIRLFNRENSQRAFIRNVRSPRDLQFALHAPLLALVDAECNLVVYKIGEGCQSEKFIEITGWNPPEEGEPHISWCPYYPETPDDPEDLVHMLAVYKGKAIAVINVSLLHDAHGGEEVLPFHEAVEFKEAIFTIPMEDRVTAACISPDSTALAVGTDAGMVAFYVINESDLKFAHNWNPRLTTAISHLHFLDILNQEDRKEDARFWKHCIAAGDGGRRLALYECVSWKCLGSLRFDYELETAGFQITVDPQLRYIHILDVDGMNLFCVELDYSAGMPKFASLTQVTFCRPLHYLIPIEATDVENEEMFPNEDAEEENRVNVKYVALGSRSMVELQVNLENFSSGNVSYENDKESEHSETRDSEPAVQLHLPSTSDYQHQIATTSYTMDREELENRLNELSTKLDNLSFQVERADCERKVSTTNENLLQVLQQFKEEFSLREDRLMANVSDLIETSRSETLQAVRSALGESSRNMEALVQASHKHAIESVHVRLGEKVRDAVSAVVVPQVDRICSQMFKQLNDSFRTGLEQYMAQFRALHSATLAAVASAATPAPSVVPADKQALLQMIKSHQAPLAFDTVLQQDDQQALEYVCRHVDPEEFFAKYRMSQSSILGMIAQLSFRLDSESDLRFRYLHCLLEHLRADDKQNFPSIQHILAELLRHLAEFQNMAPNAAMKSQARLLSTITTMKHEQVLKPHMTM